MPYIVEAGGEDDRSVDREFFPEVSRQFQARLCVPNTLTDEDRKSMPHTLLVGKPRRGGVPDVIGWSTGNFIVSQTVRDLIEELEPGIQEFVPLSARSKDGVQIAGKTDHGTYYLILYPPQLDCVVIEETDFKRGRGYKGFVGNRPPISLWPGNQCTLSASVIVNHHFWRGVEPFEFYYFCSDEFHNAFVKKNLEGLCFPLKCKMKLGIISN
ncbi:MAG: hypothetical protein MI824_24475 [Hyphomicrobiales bacterium]|nr:hypothetical protein [Hyphomicrobiales bacterium]